METRRLEYFIRIAEDGSLTRAAQVLNIAQPALSRQMRLLEDELGAALFRRTARGMALTEQGERLRSAVAGPLRELELALHAFRASSSPVLAGAVLGMPASLAGVLAKPLALALDKAFPETRLRMIEAPMGSMIDWLARGMLDFALIEEASGDQRIAERALAPLPLFLIGPPESPLEPDTPVPFAEAARLPLVLPSHHLGVRAAINAAAEHSGARLNIRFEADATWLARELVSEGIGHAMLPLAYCRRELANGSLRAWPLVGPVPMITPYLATRRNSQFAKLRHDGIEVAIYDAAAALLGSGE